MRIIQDPILDLTSPCLVVQGQHAVALAVVDAGLHQARIDLARHRMTLFMGRLGR